MLELPQTPWQPVEVNCSCCRCCNCPLSALSAVRVVASTRLALASLRSGLRSVSRHGAHGNSVKDGVEQSAADMDVVCVFVWNRSIPHAPCGSPHSTTSPRPAVFGFVFVCVDRRQIVSTTYLYTHPNMLILHYFYSKTCAEEGEREQVPLVKLAPLWGFCGDFCCLLLSEKATSLCFCSWPTYWKLTHMCGRVVHSRRGEGAVIRYDDNA